jgi:hypothetical protein
MKRKSLILAWVLVLTLLVGCDPLALINQSVSEGQGDPTIVPVVVDSGDETSFDDTSKELLETCTPPPTFTPETPPPTEVPTEEPAADDPPPPLEILPPAGQVTFPYRYADAGNFSLQAGAIITLTWEEAPLGADRYEFTVIPHQQDTPLVLGVDMDDSDGVSIQWAVPEGVAASLKGVAYFSDGQVSYSAWAGEIYSGELPPEGICSMSSASIGPLDLFREPTTSSDRLAYLTPGVYAQVFGQTGTGWYRVDAQEAIDPVDGGRATGVGWVFGQAGVELHGLCDDLPLVEPVAP